MSDDVVGTMRNLLPNALLRLELEDYLEGLITDAVSGLDQTSFPVDDPQPSGETVQERVSALDTVTTPIAKAVLVGCHYGTVLEQARIWIDALESLADTARYQPTGRVYNAWERLRFYPALLVLYSVGVGSLTARRPSTLARILAGAKWDAETPLYNEVDLGALGYVSTELVPQSSIAASSWMSQRLMELCQGTIPTRRFEVAFDETELVLGLIAADRMLGEDLSGTVVVVPARHWFSSDGARPRAEVCISGDRVQAWVEAGLFGGSADRLMEVKRRYDEAVSQARIQIQLGLSR
jgi:hypothetical protein